MSNSQCAYCGKLLEGSLAPHLCEACGIPQPLAAGDGRAEDLFAVLGTKRAFGQDSARLEKRFYELSRALHPDRFSALGARAGTDGAETVTNSIQRMTLVNRAYTTLKDPEKRRLHLLELEGLAVTEGTEGRGGNRAPVPSELAEAWFEVKDAMLEDPAEGRARLTAFEAELRGALQSEEAEMARLEREFDGTESRQVLEAIATRIRTRNYLKSMERDVARLAGVADQRA